MAVDIKLINASNVKDCRELDKLNDIFIPNIKAFFNDPKYEDVNGIIRIYPNNLLFCDSTKDIDALMTAEFVNFTLDTDKYKNLKVTRLLTTI